MEIENSGRTIEQYLHDVAAAGHISSQTVQVDQHASEGKYIRSQTKSNKALPNFGILSLNTKLLMPVVATMLLGVLPNSRLVQL